MILFRIKSLVLLLIKNKVKIIKIHQINSLLHNNKKILNLDKLIL